MNNDKKIIVICGPTASGKTGLSVSLARKFDGEIISADSRQVYKKLDLGTGKDLDEYGDVPYHLIDVCDPGEDFTLFDWLKLAREKIDDIISRGKTPFVVGGTGLYIQGLLEGFEVEKLKIKKFKNQETEESRNRENEKNNYTRQELESKSLEELQKVVDDYGIELNRSDYHNPYRLIRVIERQSRGERPVKNPPDFNALEIGLTLPRKQLNLKIDKRIEEWFEEGFYNEVKDLLSQEVSLSWLKKIGLEYGILAEYIDKFNSTYEEEKNKERFGEMKTRMEHAIHQFAKRQMTWFRRFEDIVWISPKETTKAEKLCRNFLDM